MPQITEFKKVLLLSLPISFLAISTSAVEAKTTFHIHNCDNSYYKIKGRAYNKDDFILLQSSAHVGIGDTGSLHCQTNECSLYLYTSDGFETKTQTSKGDKTWYVKVKEDYSFKVSDGNICG